MSPARSLKALFPSLALLGLALVACSSDDDGGNSGPAGGGAGSSSVGGKAGSPGVGGTSASKGGTGGTAGKGGSAGSSATAGTGGSSSEGGTGGTGDAGASGATSGGGTGGTNGNAGAGGDASQGGKSGSTGTAGKGGASGTGGKGGTAGKGGTSGNAGSGAGGTNGNAGSGSGGTNGTAGNGTAGTTGSAGNGNASGAAGTGATCGSETQPAPGESMKAALTQAQKDEILASHNAYRATKCLPPLVWSDDAANVAQAWANKCQDGGDGVSGLIDHNAGRGPYGENIAGSGGPRSAASAVASWFAEQKNYTDGVGCAMNQVCGHYTQIMWKKTTAVGCGISVCDSLKYKYSLVCDYSPPGNYGGQLPY